jgi:acetyl/propionyl-CoA carboxylase alpha subunit
MRISEPIAPQPHSHWLRARIGAQLKSGLDWLVGMFTRIAVVNRGEAARRLIHAVRELNAQRDLTAGEVPVKTIALYTESERHALFVREADLGYCLGPASARPYLDLGVLEQALVETGADAAWPGWGFVAEDPTFAQLCGRLGVAFIGPGPEAMCRLGDKIGAKLLAEEVGVPAYRHRADGRGD